MKRAAERYLVKDSGFIMDLATGHSFTANATGLVIFRALMEGASLAETVQRVCRDFAIDPDTAQRDVDEFVQELRVFRLHED
jgi:hypothetical protein